MMLDCFDRDKRVSLYIHIPFCASKCSYCAFYSIPKNKQDEELRTLYFERLIQEVQKTKEYFNKPFKTIYIGGGTPLLQSHLPYIERLLKTSNAVESEEVTIECNVDNYNKQVASLINQYITRLSVGIQSFDKNVLKLFARKKTSDDDIKNILTFGKDIKINFDFILGIPNYYDTKKDIEHLFNIADENHLKRPEHLSVYLLTLEDNTPLKRILKQPQDDEKCANELKEMWDFLKINGYDHYEVSAFSKGEKNRCSHNLRYWELNDYIGLGASATSHSTRGFDITFDEDYKEYAKGVPFQGYNIERLNKTDIASELLLTHLRTTYGLTEEKFNCLTGYSLTNTIKRANSKNPEAQILKFYKNGRFALPNKELLFSDYYIRLLNDNLVI